MLIQLRYTTVCLKIDRWTNVQSLHDYQMHVIWDVPLFHFQSSFCVQTSYKIYRYLRPRNPIVWLLRSVPVAPFSVSIQILPNITDSPATSGRSYWKINVISTCLFSFFELFRPSSYRKCKVHVIWYSNAERDNLLFYRFGRYLAIWTVALYIRVINLITSPYIKSLITNNAVRK